MDTLTHVIIGATVARATAGRSKDPCKLPVKARIWLGGLAAAFPDTDYLGYLVDPLSFISDWHRSVTHSFIMLPFWALLLGLMYARFTHNRHQWRDASTICGLSITSHILSDIITSWSTKILAPISDYTIALGTTFVIDPYFSLIVLVGLFLSVQRNSSAIAGMALLSLLMYIGLQALLKQQVHEIALSQVERNQWAAGSIYIMPQPYSPFNWKVIITQGEQYHMAYLNLNGGEDESMARRYLNVLITNLHHYRSESKLLWSYYSKYGSGRTREVAQAAWKHSAFERYRRFALKPAFKQIIYGKNETCVEFMDLRYKLPEYSTPFSYALCQNIIDNSARVMQPGLWPLGEK